jgi:hypothetical protein
MGLRGYELIRREVRRAISAKSISPLAKRRSRWPNRRGESIMGLSA